MKKIIIGIILLITFACTQAPNNDGYVVNEVKEYKPSGFGSVSYPVKIQIVRNGGMKYVIASGYYGDSGVDIANVTLDSLMVEYYKKELNGR